MTAEEGGELARAIEVIRQLLGLIDRKWLMISWRESDLRLVAEARAFVEANGG